MSLSFHTPPCHIVGEGWTSLTTPPLQCLLPLANTPLIEYTLEFLAMNGVQHVIIYCGPHTDQVEKYVQESPRWSPESTISPFSILEFVRVSDARSTGDFLRDLDGRGVIGGDFILVHGDVVANVPLDDALAKHRARREANREAIMTMLLRPAGEGEHRTKSHGITPVFVIQPSTSRCLHYEEQNPLQSEHYLFLDSTVLENTDFEIRRDLIDCGIDICTPDVLALWSESFDYELPRKNFLHGVLKDWELNGKLIHAEVLEGGYAARAHNLQQYDAVSRDVLGRWTYPLVPDSNLVEGHVYQLPRRGVCLEDGVLIAQGASITNAVIGRTTGLGNGSTVVNSVIGRRCKIGDNVRIEDSYIWDDVTIGDGASVKRSVLADSVAVGRGASIPEGSLISFGVHVGDGIQLPAAPIPVLSLVAAEASESQVETDVELVGKDGKGARYREFTDDDDDDDEDGGSGEPDPAILQKGLIYSLEGLDLATSSVSTFATHDSEESDDDMSQLTSPLSNDTARMRSRLSSFASDDSGASVLRSGGFHTDAVSGLLDALRADDTSDFDSAKLEFMGLRLGTNASDQAMRRAVAVSFVRRAAELLTPEYGSLEPAKAAEKALKDKDGAVKFIREVGIGGKEKEQMEFAVALQKALVGVKGLELTRAGTLLSAFFQQLYNEDVVEEDAILAWWADKRASEGESMSKVRERCRVLVEWLENADEEDSDEDDESDEESD